jgi:hypothetical protein
MAMARSLQEARKQYNSGVEELELPWDLETGPSARRLGLEEGGGDDCQGEGFTKSRTIWSGDARGSGDTFSSCPRSLVSVCVGTFSGV